jgi:hypothetical protein
MPLRLCLRRFASVLSLRALRPLIPLPLLGSTLVGAPVLGAPQPVGLAAEAPVGSGLHLRLNHRTRFEDRGGDLGNFDALFLRTELGARLDRGRWFLEGEVIDARILAEDEGPVNTTLVNAVEPVELVAGLRLGSGAGPRPELRLGVQTLDLGARRLVARNRWRNTTNTFVGARLDLPGTDGSRTIAFAFSPLRRLPDDEPGLREADVRVDRASSDRRFLGVFHAFRARPAEAYLFHLDEDGGPGGTTADRSLWTLGGRLYRDAGPGRWDWELEGALQWGELRTSVGALGTPEQDVLASFVHAQLGHTPEDRRRPRLSVEFDFASGDEDVTDGDANGFDALFGAAVGDLGPRGYWSLLPRRNVVVAGPRIDFELPRDLDATVRTRGAWLHRAGPGASTPLTDPGERWLGVQTELQLRWRPRGVPWFATAGFSRLDGEQATVNYVWLQGSIRLEGRY